MTDLNQDFTMFQGEHKTLAFPITDEDGNALSVAAYKECNWLAYHPIYRTTKITKTLSDGCSVSGTYAFVDLAPADTSGLDPDIYTHELQLVASGSFGTVESLVAEGKMTLYHSILG